MESMELLAIVERAIRAVREDEVAEIEVDHTVNLADERVETTTVTVRAEVGKFAFGFTKDDE